ncbi:MAG: PAS domain-containing protein [Verrucomicrobiae bacterium]|nr:PAS domain-containing protein [Verrucomicrobiae bacterium]
MSVPQPSTNHRDVFQILKQNKIMQEILEAGLACICVKDRQGRFIYVNQADADLYNARPEDLIGKTVEHLVGRRQFEEWLREDNRVMDGGTPIQLPPYERTDLSGKKRWLDSVKIPLVGSNGACERLIVIHRDVTSLVRAEAERERLQIQLLRSQKMEAMATMAGGVAHNFNNLMMVIMTVVDMMKHKHPVGDIAEDLAKIDLAVTRASEITKKMLGMARTDEVTEGPVNLNAVVRQVRQLAQTSFPSRITLTVSLHDPLPDLVGNEDEIEQCLLNLLINSRDALEEEPGEILIETRFYPNARGLNLSLIREESPVICLSVADAGCGMDENTIEHIFEPFFTTKEDKGTGLGLSFVYTVVVNRHRGELKLKSTPGEGTRFDLFFPLADPGTTPPPHPR